MSTDVVGLIQAIVEHRLRGIKTADLGVVTAAYPHESSSDKNNYQCDVKLRDSGVELKRVAIATQHVGAASIPNVNDLVVVHYLNGDIHSAVITGRLYNDKDRPPQSKSGEVVYVSPDPAKSGVRRLYLEFPSGNSLQLDDDALTLTMGNTSLVVNHDGDVVINSNGGNITLCDQNKTNQIEINSSGGEISIKSQVKVSVDAPQIELAGGASHPLVYGDQLLQYLNQVVATYQSHMHPGQVAGVLPVTPAPPVPPLPPATPSLLSLTVKTG